MRKHYEVCLGNTTPGLDSMVSSVDEAGAPVNSGANTSDFWFTTLYRWTELYGNNFSGQHAAKGFMGDLATQHKEVGISLLVIITMISIANIAHNAFNQAKQKKQARLDRESSTLAINEQLQPTTKTEEQPIPAAVTLEQFNEGLKTALTDLNKIQGLKHDYTSVELVQKNNQFHLKLTEEIKEKTIWQKLFSGLGNIWDFLSLSSFLYWLLWIGGFSLTGQLDVGVAGLPDGAAFGLPLGVGFASTLGILLRNWFLKNRPEYFKNKMIKWLLTSEIAYTESKLANLGIGITNVIWRMIKLVVILLPYLGAREIYQKGSNACKWIRNKYRKIFYGYNPDNADEDDKKNTIDDPIMMAPTVLDDTQVLLASGLEAAVLTELRLLTPKMPSALEKPTSTEGKPVSSETKKNPFRRLLSNFKIKMAMVLASAIILEYSLAQYNAWVVTDLLQQAGALSAAAMGCFLAVTIGGVLLIVLGFGRAFYQALVTTPQQLKEDQEKIATLKKQYGYNSDHIDDLQQEIEQRRFALNDRLEQTKLFLANLDTDSAKRASKLVNMLQPLRAIENPNTWPKTWSKPWWGKITARGTASLLASMTGVFFMRIFLIKGNAIWLPFAAAALGGHFTLGILVGVAIIWAIYKCYEYHKKQQQKADRAYLDALVKDSEQLKMREEILQRADHIIEESDKANKALNDQPSPQPALSITPVPTPAIEGAAVKSVTPQPSLRRRYSGSDVAFFSKAADSKQDIAIPASLPVSSTTDNANANDPAVQPILGKPRLVRSQSCSSFFAKAPMSNSLQTTNSTPIVNSIVVPTTKTLSTPAQVVQA